MRIGTIINFTAGVLAAAAVFSSGAHADEGLGYPASYRCEDGTTATIDVDTQVMTIAPVEGPPLIIPARYAQSTTIYYQTEPQEIDCTTVCGEVILRGEPKLWLVYNGKNTSCDPVAQ